MTGVLTKGGNAGAKTDMRGENTTYTLEGRSQGATGSWENGLAQTLPRALRHSTGPDLGWPASRREDNMLLQLVCDAS